VADVTGRAFFGNPVPGTTEIARLTVVAIAFLAVPYAMRRRSHIRSTVVLTRVPELVRRGLQVVAYLSAAVVFTLIARASWSPMMEAWRRGDWVEGAIRVPTAPTRTVIVIASILVVLESLSALVYSIRGREDPETETLAGHVS
jgi:TRAP-type C4-dicarboxylate transport system permease small subunit